MLYILHYTFSIVRVIRRFVHRFFGEICYVTAACGPRFVYECYSRDEEYWERG